MRIEGGYFEAEDDNLLMTTRESKQGMNYPCPLDTCVITFSSEDDMMKHMETENHATGNLCSMGSGVDDRVKKSWVVGLSGKLEDRKSGKHTKQLNIFLTLYLMKGLRAKLSGENLENFEEESVFVPFKGWALFERAVPARLNPEARAYLVELFEAGKANRNHRVNPEEAELKIRNQFPTKEESWLTVKQVMIISQFNYIEEYQYHSDKKFVQPSG